MNQIILDPSSILPLLWAFSAGIILGVLYAYSLGRRRGFQEAVQQRTREETARAFAEYINNIAKGGPGGGPKT